MKKNIVESDHTSEDHQLGCALLDWGETKYEDIIIQTAEKNELDEIESTDTALEDYGKFDLIIAAEVVYWEQSIIPLVTIIDELFTKHDNKLIFYLIFLERSYRLHTQLVDAFKNHKFTFEYLDDPLTKNTSVYP